MSDNQEKASMDAIRKKWIGDEVFLQALDDWLEKFVVCERLRGYMRKDFTNIEFDLSNIRGAWHHVLDSNTPQDRYIGPVIRQGDEWMRQVWDIYLVKVLVGDSELEMVVEI